MNSSSSNEEDLVFLKKFAEETINAAKSVDNRITKLEKEKNDGKQRSVDLK